MKNNRSSHDSETPQHGQQVITACAFIYNIFDDVYKVFLPRRAQTKKFLPGVYELPGGHIEFGEDLRSGLQREIREEFGMEIILGDVFFAFTYMNEIKGAHAVEVVFMAQFVGDLTLITLDPADHESYQWVSCENVNKLFTQNKSCDDPEVAAIYAGFDKISQRKNNNNTKDM